MYDPRLSAQYRRDIETLKTRKYDMPKMDEVIVPLLKGETLPPEKRDHALSGKWKGYRECHITNTWLLIYKIENKLLLYLARTGTHSDLFG